MPVYQVTAPDGRQVRLTGDSPPSDADLDEIFKSLPPAKPKEAPQLSFMDKLRAAGAAASAGSAGSFDYSPESLGAAATTGALVGGAAMAPEWVPGAAKTVLRVAGNPYVAAGIAGATKLATTRDPIAAGEAALKAGAEAKVLQFGTGLLGRTPGLLARLIMGAKAGAPLAKVPMTAKEMENILNFMREAKGAVPAVSEAAPTITRAAEAAPAVAESAPSLAPAVTSTGIPGPASIPAVSVLAKLAGSIAPVGESGAVQVAKAAAPKVATAAVESAAPEVVAAEAGGDADLMAKLRDSISAAKARAGGAAAGRMGPLPEVAGPRGNIAVTPKMADEIQRKVLTLTRDQGLSPRQAASALGIYGIPFGPAQKMVAMILEASH